MNKCGAILLAFVIVFSSFLMDKLKDTYSDASRAKNADVWLKR